MSLDVYLYGEEQTTEETCRSCGHVRKVYCSPVLFTANITHNLNTMADAAGIYYALWRPDEIGAFRASDLTPLLRAGISKLLALPEYFKTMNPANGWGSYDGLVRFVTKYLEACEQNPEARVAVSR